MVFSALKVWILEAGTEDVFSFGLVRGLVASQRSCRHVRSNDVATNIYLYVGGIMAKSSEEEKQYSVPKVTYSFVRGWMNCCCTSTLRASCSASASVSASALH